MALHITTQETERGDVLGVRLGDQTVSMLIADNIPEASKPHVAKVRTVFTEIAMQVETLNRDLTQIGLTEKLKTKCNPLRGPVQGMIETGVVDSQQIARTYDRLDKLPEPTVIEPVIVGHFMTLDLSGKIEFINRANTAQLAAIIRMGREVVLPGVDPAIYQGLIHRYRRLGQIAAYGLQAQFSGTATVEDPFAPARPDLAKAENAASESLRAVANDQEKIDNLKQIVQRVTQMVSIMCGVPVHRAFAFLTGEESL